MNHDNKKFLNAIKLEMYIYDILKNLGCGTFMEWKCNYIVKAQVELAVFEFF